MPPPPPNILYILDKQKRKQKKFLAHLTSLIFSYQYLVHILSCNHSSSQYSTKLVTDRKSIYYERLSEELKTILCLKNVYSTRTLLKVNQFSIFSKSRGKKRKENEKKMCYKRDFKAIFFL